MKASLGVAVLAAVFLQVFSHHLEMCQKDDAELISQLQCQREHATPEFNTKLDRVNTQLQCDSDFCTIRKLCKEPNFEIALKRFFSESELEVLHELANYCDQGHDHSHGHHH